MRTRTECRYIYTHNIYAHKHIRNLCRRARARVRRRAARGLSARCSVVLCCGDVLFLCAVVVVGVVAVAVAVATNTLTHISANTYAQQITHNTNTRRERGDEEKTQAKAISTTTM